MKKQTKNKPTSSSAEKSSTFLKIENFFENNPKLLFIIPIALVLVFGTLLFNLRLDEGGDDSAYINRAVDFLQDGTIPSYQGPVYPLFLSVLIAIFGLKLLILKSSSLLFLIGAVFFFIKALKGRTSNIVILSTTILLGVNSYFLYFGSQTYNEALFLFIQSILLWRFFRYKDKFGDSVSFSKLELLSLLQLGFLLFFAFQTRTIAVSLILAVVVALTFNKKFLQAGVIVLVVLFSTGVVKVVENNLTNGKKTESQLNTLLYKHPYDFSQGKEDVSGFFLRIVDNSNLYIGKQFLKIAGFKDTTNKEYSVLFTLMFYATLLVGFYFCYRKSQYLFFIFLYLVIYMLTTFVTIQKIWDQYRLIIPFVPLIFFLAYQLLFTFVSQKTTKTLQPLYFVFFGLMFFLTATSSVKKMNPGNLIVNITTNKYQGYTPDWENYLKVAEYASSSLPTESYIAVRKPDMARIYCNGKKFYGIFRLSSDNPDSLVTQLEKAKVTHIILASLRKNPEVNSGEVINTLHRLVSIIYNKYPKSFTELKVVGGNNEPAALYQINYQFAKPN